MKRMLLLTAPALIFLAGCSARLVVPPAAEAARVEPSPAEFEIGFAISIPLAPASPAQAPDVATITSETLRARLDASGLLEPLRASRPTPPQPAPRALRSALIPLTEPLGPPMYEAFHVANLIEAGLDPSVLIDVLEDLAPPTGANGRYYGVAKGELVVNLRLSSLRQAERVLEALQVVLLND